MKRFSLAKAFTLTETLITLVIFVVVIIVVFNIYIGGRRFYTKGETIAELLQNGRVIQERMVREIRQAREIVTPLSPTSSQATSTIEFEDGHSTTTYRYIRYWQEGDLVKREVRGYYFSGDESQTLVPWDATPPKNQTLESKILEEPAIIGEHVDKLEIWGSGSIVHLLLNLTYRGEEVKLRTEIFGRNL